MAKTRRHRSRTSPRPWTKGSTITFRLKDEDRATLEDMARELELPLSELLRQALTIVARAWRADDGRIPKAGTVYAEALASGLKAALAEEGKTKR